MRVLFLSQRVPWPPDRGDRITTCHFLGHLLARGAEVYVGCLAEDPRDLEAAETLRARVRDICAPRIHRSQRKLTSLRGLVTGEALTLPFFRDRRLSRQIAKWRESAQFDLIYVYSSSMAQYALDHDKAVRLMQFAELDSDKWRQFAERSRGPGAFIYRREARTLLEFERRVARTFDESFVVSEVEKELFMQLIPEVEPVVLQNGVDVEHFASAGDAERDPHTLVFTGVMDYEPNVDGVLWFVETCWPGVRQRFPDAKLLVVGSRPCRAIEELGQRDGIEVTGRVPETPPYFDRATVSIAPLRLARGVQNKVLEAMSMGLAVVSSPQAAQGLGDVPADTMIVADGAEATTAGCLRLLEQPAEARAMGQRAAHYIRQHFRWERMFERLDEVIRRHVPDWR